MQVVNLDDIEWFGHVNHREGGIDFKRIFCGDTISANNFEFNLAVVNEAFSTPRHRHNFDQVRFLIAGEFGFDKGKIQKAGTIGYFPEGTYYTQGAKGPSQTLLLQCANASHSPFMDFSGLRKNVAELEQKGEFKDGVFTYYDDQGKKHNSDGHQAIWEHATGEELKFPKPRYQSPIFMNPDLFDYRPLQSQPGVYRKKMLRVTERELEIGFLKLDPEATYHYRGGDGRYIYFAMKGAGRAENAGQVDAWSKDGGILLEDEDVTIVASEPSEFYYLRLPTLV